MPDLVKTENNTPIHIDQSNQIFTRKDVYQLNKLPDKFINKKSISKLIDELTSYYNKFWLVRHSDLIPLIHFPANLEHKYLGRDIGIDPDTIGLYNEELFKELDRARIAYDKKRTIGILEQKGGINPNRISPETFRATSELEYADDVVLLELGDYEKGMIHILEEHRGDFEKHGYREDAEIVKLILTNVKNNKYIRDPSKGFSYVYKFTNKDGEVKFLRVWKESNFHKIINAYIVDIPSQLNYLHSLFQKYNI